jgi:hypothetical protein
MMLAKNNIKLVSLLVISIAVLITLIIAEWGSMRLARQALLEDVNKVETRGYDIEELPSIDLLQTSVDEYSEMVNRPLFIKGRRPIENIASNAADPIITGDFKQTLIGIYGTEQGMSALFKNTSPGVGGPKFYKVFVGDDVEGWKIDEIHNDKVVLSQAGSQQQANLHKPRPKRIAIPKKKKRLAPPKLKQKKSEKKLNKLNKLNKL